jgi:hypothetical protein
MGLRIYGCTVRAQDQMGRNEGDLDIEDRDLVYRYIDGKLAMPRNARLRYRLGVFALSVKTLVLCSAG